MTRHLGDEGVSLMRGARDRTPIDGGAGRSWWVRGLVVAGLAATTIAAATMATAGSPELTNPTGPPGPNRAEREQSAEQVVALADGVVDYDEYHEGARRHIACLAAAGYEVVMEEETFDLINFGTPEEAVLSGVEEACYQAEWEAIDMAWQGTHIETSETAFIMARCLEEHGIEVPATIVEKDAAITADGIPFGECL